MTGSDAELRQAVREMLSPTADDVADSILALASRACSFMIGEVVKVDGGYSLKAAPAPLRAPEYIVDFSNRQGVALDLGASGGIGSETAALLPERGGRAAMACRRPSARIKGARR